MSVNVAEDLLEPTVKVILLCFCGEGLCLPFCFVLIVFWFFDYTICMLFINGIENCYDCTLYLLFPYCNFDLVHN